MLKVSLQTNVEDEDLLILRGLRETKKKKKMNLKFSGEERKEKYISVSLLWYCNSEC